VRSLALAASSSALLLAACSTAHSSGDRFTYSIVADDDAPRWRAFRAEDAGFHVDFPADPARSVSRDGAEAVDLFAARLAGASYLVGVVEAPVDAIEGADRALEAYPAEVAAQVGGDVTADARAVIGGAPARSVEIAPQEGGLMRLLVVATPARVYLVSVATRDDALPPEADRFLASFRAAP